ncbi:hypothetical protein H4R19_005432 [Coemansia spiralis]|nr:hypothetical protein H4R19_005432 [Coemansia spiralis]
MSVSAPVDHRFTTPLTIVASIALAGSLSSVVTFVALMTLNTRRVDLSLVKMTMVIQSVTAISQIVTILLNDVRMTAVILCSSVRYVLNICYLTSIFTCCAITIHLWLVIARRRLEQARRAERLYYIVPITLAIVLAAGFSTIPSSVFHKDNRCAPIPVPPREYLGLRWGFFYSWFVLASAISFYCMAGVLRSVRQLVHSTRLHGSGSQHPSSTEAHRGQVNARANSKRLRSLVFYTIAYPLISFASHFPALIQELLSFALKRELAWLVFLARLILYSEGLLLAAVFFLYPAVSLSIRELVNAAVQYWVADQEEFWHVTTDRQLCRHAAKADHDERTVRDFTSRRGRIYHFVLSKTPEGRLTSFAQHKRASV